MRQIQDPLRESSQEQQGQRHGYRQDYNVGVEFIQEAGKKNWRQIRTFLEGGIQEARYQQQRFKIHPRNEAGRQDWRQYIYAIAQAETDPRPETE